MMSARMCAFEILHETFTAGAYPNLLYKEKAIDLDDRDRKLVTLIVNDTLSNLIHIDYILKGFTGGKRVNTPIRDILRMSIDQIQFLKLPEHAVINEAVDMCGKIGKPMLKGFVNGVLRNYLRNRDVKYPKEGTLEYYSIIHSKPLWLMELWNQNYGFENTVKYSKVRMAPTVIRSSNGFDAKAWMDQQGYKYREVDIISNAYELTSSYAIHECKDFKNGNISIQGVGSMAACVALDPKSGDKLLDACSAPGGKTVFLAQIMGSGEIISCDLYDSRLNLVEGNLKRCGIAFAKTKKDDMTVFNPDFENQFDRVLVDAPCSGLGVINSKGDIIINKTLDDIYELSKVQYKILSNCSKYVKSGGVMVYSTCTINKIENDNVVSKFLKKNSDFSLEPFKLDDGQKIESGMLQLTPDVYEGFFVARFKRV